MGYLGQSPSQYEQTLEVRSDVFSANGTQTTYILTFAVNKTTDIEVLANGTQLSPHNGSYSVNGTTLTISPAVSVGSNNVSVVYRMFFQASPAPGVSSVITDYIAPLAVTSDKVAEQAITSSKIANNISLGAVVIGGPSAASNTLSLNTRASSANHATQKKYVDALTIIFGA